MEAYLVSRPDTYLMLAEEKKSIWTGSYYAKASKTVKM